MLGEELRACIKTAQENQLTSTYFYGLLFLTSTNAYRNLSALVNSPVNTPYKWTGSSHQEVPQAKWRSPTRALRCGAKPSVGPHHAGRSLSKAGPRPAKPLAREHTRPQPRHSHESCPKPRCPHCGTQAGRSVDAIHRTCDTGPTCSRQADSARLARGPRASPIEGAPQAIPFQTAGRQLSHFQAITKPRRPT